METSRIHQPVNTLPRIEDALLLTLGELFRAAHRFGLAAAELVIVDFFLECHCRLLASGKPTSPRSRRILVGQRARVWSNIFR